MGVFDQSAQFATSEEPRFVLMRLGPLLKLNLDFRRWFDTKTIPLPGGPDREADLVAVADDLGDATKLWLLIFEFQSQHDPDKPKVLQLETMIFLCHARDTDRGGGELLPLAVFVYLKGTCPQKVASVRTPSGLGFTGEPAIWEIAGDSAADALAKVELGEYSWGALFWVSLMAGAEDESVIRDWLRLRDEKVPEKKRADLTHIARVFAELAGRLIAWDRVLGEEIMTESTVVNQILEKGEMRMARRLLLDVIKERFPEMLTPDVENAVADQPSLDLLRDWHSAAVRAKTADEFLSVLRN